MLVNGYLIFKSGYLPELVGILMLLAGLSYLTACFVRCLILARRFNIAGILLPPLIGESSFWLWLLVKGVDIAEVERGVEAGQGISRILP